MPKLDDTHTVRVHALMVDNVREAGPTFDARYAELSKSFSVQTKMRQAKQLADAYDIDGVPTLGVHGRFHTSGSLAGDNMRALAVAEALIARVRKGA
jgi:hypothetical protein